MQIADVSDHKQVKELVQSVVEKFGHLDVVVSNAGIFEGGEVEHVSDEVWHKLFSVNMDGLFYLTKEALPYLIKSHGNIVVGTSVSGLRGDCGQTAYNSTKHAMNGFVRCVALDYGAKGARINAFAPGFIETDINKEVWTNPERVKPYLDRVALNRTGRAEDCAGIALFLASDDASCLTGLVVPVDGGTTAATGQAVIHTKTTPVPCCELADLQLADGVGDGLLRSFMGRNSPSRYLPRPAHYLTVKPSCSP